MTQAVGTPLWMAPEVVLSNSYGPPCDVFSFAIIMSEILTEKRPYYDKPANPPIFVQVSMNPDFRPTLPDLENNSNDLPLKTLEMQAKFVALVRRCWAHKPEDRPKFSEIVDELRKIENNSSDLIL